MSGLMNNTNASKVSKEQKTIIKKLFLQGFGCNIIARETGLSVNVALCNLNKIKLMYGSRTIVNRQKKKKAKQMYLQHYSIVDIAKVLKLDRRTVKAWIVSIFGNVDLRKASIVELNNKGFSIERIAGFVRVDKNTVRRVLSV